MFDQNELYRFYFDQDNIAENEMRKWNGKARHALEVSKQLLQHIDEVYQQALTEDEEDEDEEGGFTVDVDAAFRST